MKKQMRDHFASAFLCYFSRLLEIIKDDALIPASAALSATDMGTASSAVSIEQLIKNIKNKDDGGFAENEKEKFRNSCKL